MTAQILPDDKSFQFRWRQVRETSILFINTPCGLDNHGTSMRNQDKSPDIIKLWHRLNYWLQLGCRLQANEHLMQTSAAVTDANKKDIKSSDDRLECIYVVFCGSLTLTLNCLKFQIIPRADNVTIPGSIAFHWNPYFLPLCSKVLIRYFQRLLPSCLRIEVRVLQVSIYLKPCHLLRTKYAKQQNSVVLTLIKLTPDRIQIICMLKCKMT